MEVLHTCDYDIINVFGPPPHGEVVRHSVYVVDVKEAALGSAEKAREVLNGVAFGGSVDDAEHIFYMIL